MTPGEKRDLEAAFWAELIRDPALSFEEMDRALLWVDALPENRRAFDKTRRFLEALEMTAEAALTMPPRTPRKRLWRLDNPLLRFPRTLAAAAAAAIVAIGSSTLVFTLDWSPFTPGEREVTRFEQRYASSIGQVRKVSLPDGSSATLAGASAISIAFHGAQRHVVLTDGEAMFAVRHDPSRPFIVNTGTGAAEALGTSFNVHRNLTGATITVLEGKVLVSAIGKGTRSSTQIGANVQMSFGDDGRLGPRRLVDARSVVAWQRGELQFLDQPLAAVVADLNRYSPTPIIIDAPSLAKIPVTGTVTSAGMIEWLYSLETALGIKVLRSADSIRLVERSTETAALDLAPDAKIFRGHSQVVALNRSC